jgi:hypothetical protein
MDENTSSPVIVFAVADVETAAEALSLSVTASDSGLFPAGSITLGGSGTNRTLVLTPAPNRFGSATVTVVLTDAEGGTNAMSFGVTVIQVVIPPAILVQPVGRTVTNGAPVTLAMTVAGTLPITYQWKLNGSDIPGATNAVLTIVSAGATNAGTYRVLAANAAGSILSDVALLRVLISPIIQSIVRAEPGVEISFPTFSNLSYTVEFTDGAEPLVWLPLTTVAGTGAVLTVTDPSSLASRL